VLSPYFGRGAPQEGITPEEKLAFEKFMIEVERVGAAADANLNAHTAQRATPAGYGPPARIKRSGKNSSFDRVSALAVLFFSKQTRQSPYTASLLAMNCERAGISKPQIAGDLTICQFSAGREARVITKIGTGPLVLTTSSPSCSLMATKSAG
jgi:hypothetical protein